MPADHRPKRRPSGNPPPPDAAPFHGRRKGKSLRAHHAGLMQELLPRLALDIETARRDPRALFTHDPVEVRIEIGFGGGENLVREAGANPSVGIIGFEPFVNGVAKALALIEEEGVENIRIHPGEAGRVIAHFPDACLSRIDLFYPDPWPKRRQRKRRFVSDEMLATFARLLKPGGLFRFATDIDDYAGWTLARIARSPAFVWEAEGAADWRTPYEGWQSTRYEEKALREGRVPAYFRFRRK